VSKRSGLVILAATLSLAEAAQADPLQDQLVAAARAEKPAAYRFRRTIASANTGEAQRTFVEQFDPRKPAAEQWTLVSIDGKPPTAKQLASARKAKREPDPGYAGLVDWFGGKATRIEAEPGQVTYHFASLPKGTFKIGSHDASADAQAEVQVNRRGPIPFIERVRIGTDKAFRMMLVASVKSVVVTRNFAMLADGHIVPSGVNSIIAGSMMGKTGEIRTTVTFADYQPAR
jgi:hypothetical protein